jgi:hypothetical protein
MVGQRQQPLECTDGVDVLRVHLHLMLCTRVVARGALSGGQRSTEWHSHASHDTQH